MHLNPVAAGLVNDPARFGRCGHAEALGLREPRLLDVNGLLAGFGEEAKERMQEEYLAFVRTIAEVRWLKYDIERLPWWIEAKHTDEIASHQRHPHAQTFDGCSLENDRCTLKIGDIVKQFEKVTGQRVSDLASRRRDPELIEGRIELTAITAGRYGCRICDIAHEISKHSGSVSRWLTMGAERERDDWTFRKRLDDIDRAISDNHRAMR